MSVVSVDGQKLFKIVTPRLTLVAYGLALLYARRQAGRWRRALLKMTAVIAYSCRQLRPPLRDMGHVL